MAVRLSIVVAVLAVLGVSGFWLITRQSVRDQGGIPTDPVSQDYVASRADAALVFPGAKLVTRTAEPEQRAINVGAQLQSTIQTNALPTAVLGWYSSALEARGWRLTGSEDFRNQKLSAGVQRTRDYQRGARERMEIGLCDGCIGPKDAGNEPVLAGDVDVRYWILPFSCLGRNFCGLGISS